MNREYVIGPVVAFFAGWAIVVVSGMIVGEKPNVYHDYRFAPISAVGIAILVLGLMLMVRIKQ